MKPENQSAAGNVKEVVLTFISALNKEDFTTAKECLHDDMLFEGVMASRSGADAYISDMQKMKYKYNIQKTFTDESDVCVLYDIDMSGKATLFTCGWYKVEGNKIKKIKVVFDPRPLLEKTEKK